MNTRNWGWLVLALFFCSGATALVYEVVWSKFLSQIFGSTIYAQTAVLATFMGGLALGNKLLGRWADRLKQPVLAYGYLEIIIGLYAFFFPSFEQLADRAFVAVGSGIAEHTLLLLGVKGILSALLLLGPTIMMGGTLPLLAAWLQKSSAEAGRRSAMFYSVNSLGAVAGAGIAGFWLIQNLGLVSSLQMTALVNILIGVTAGLLTRSGRLGIVAVSEPVADSPADAPASKNWHWHYGIVATTGAISMGLEVLASRSLAMIFGSSIQSFAVVLMSFIIGIGLGSAWIASSRRRNFPDEKLVALFLCAAALWLTLLVFNLERWTDLYRIAQTGLGRTNVGYFYHQVLTTVISLVFFGVPAACIGAVLPLMIRAESARGTALGNKVGALLTCNTLGAVAGTLIAGFVLMPLVGLRNAFGVVAVIAALAALVVAWQYRWRRGCGLAVFAVGFACCLFAFGGETWRCVMSSAVFRSREKEFDPNAMAVRKLHTKILFYEDSPDATVSVEQGDFVPGVPSSADRCLRVNGKQDASAHTDLNSQYLLVHLPMLSKPGAKDVFIFGLGSGISVGALTSYPVDKIVVAENCEPVIRASRYFNDWNRNVLADPRLHLWREDARTVLKLNPQRYDVIIAQPSNPWTVGIGSVFSSEFYQIAASRLKPGGIMAQWFHAYEMHDGIMELVLHTFSSAFPHVEIWDVGGDIIMLGSFESWPTGPKVFAPGFALPGVRSDMQQLGIFTPEQLFVRQLASQRTASAITGDGPIQSDLFPVLEYAAPRAFYFGQTATMLSKYDERGTQQLLAPADKLAILHSLTLEQTLSVFSGWGSINPDLLPSMVGLPRAGTSSPAPCVFNSNTPCITVPPMPVDDPTNAAILSRAAGLLDGSSEHQREAFGLIASVVEAPTAATSQPLAAWTSLAATIALGKGDIDQAQNLAALALKQNPADAQAGYILRLLHPGK